MSFGTVALGFMLSPVHPAISVPRPFGSGNFATRARINVFRRGPELALFYSR